MLSLVNALHTISGSFHEQMYSLSLDGAGDFLNLGNQDLIGAGDFSISIWAKHTGSDYANDTWVGKYQDSDNNWFFGVKSADPPVVYFYSEVGGSDKTVLQGTTNLDGSEFTSGSWHHFVVSCDRNGNEIIYIDGLLEVSASGEATDLDNTGDLQIGALNSASGMQGFMDHVAIFNVALDADAVSAMYNNGKPFDLNVDRGNYDNASGLVGYWKMFNGPFDDKANSVVHDAHNPGYGAELVTNGDFSTNGEPISDSWSLGWSATTTGQSGSTIASNNLTITSDSSTTHYGRVKATDGSSSINILNATLGGTYKCTYIVSANSGSPTLKAHADGVDYVEIASTVGSHVFYFRNAADRIFLLSNTTSGTSTVSISNLSIKQLNGYPGIAAADATFSTNTPDDQTMSNVLTLDGVNDFLSTQADSTAATRGYSFWARSTETATNRGVFSHGSSSVMTGTFSFNWTTSGDNANKPIITLEDSNNGFIYFNTTDKQDDGNWHHWFVYIDPTEINNCKCWVDGVTLPESTKAALSAGANAYGPLRIGGGNEYFKGEIDKFAVFDTELAADAIASLAGQMWDGIDGDDANWVVYGSNTKAEDTGAVKITEAGGTQSDRGAFIYLRDISDLNADLIPGRTYKLTCEVKVSGGSLQVTVGNNMLTASSSAITSTSFVTATLYFTDVAGSSLAHLRFTGLDSTESVWIKSISLIDTEARKNDLTQTIGNYDSDWTDNLINYWKMGDGNHDEIAHVPVAGYSVAATDQEGLKEAIIHDQVNPGFGDELVTNGDFSNGTTGWAISTSSVSSTAAMEVFKNGNQNEMNITSGTGSDAGYGIIYASVAWVVGKTYKFECDVLEVVAADGAANHGRYVRIAYLNATGALTGSGNISGDTNLSLADGNPARYSVYFTIPSTMQYLSIGARHDVIRLTIANVSVKEVNGNPGITTSGSTIIKQPV